MDCYNAADDGFKNMEENKMKGLIDPQYPLIPIPDAPEPLDPDKRPLPRNPFHIVE